jgi:hypothetical protein
MPRPAFARASQKVVTAITLLDALLTPSTDGMDMLYRQLKEIIGITATEQTKSTLQHRVEISISISDRSKGGRQKAATEPLMAGTTFSPIQISVHDRLSCP